MVLNEDELQRALTRWQKYIEPMPNGCVLWKGGKTAGGGKIARPLGRPRKKAPRVGRGGPYGSFNVGYKKGTIRAHIFSAYVKGIIPTLRVPEGHHIDHTCENTLCVECLELVPSKVNLERRWRR